MIDKETIIQRCFIIAMWARKRGEASLKGDHKGIERCDIIIDREIDKLVRLVKDDRN